MDRGAWQATVHRVSKSQTWLKQLSLAQHKSLWVFKSKLLVRWFGQMPDFNSNKKWEFLTSNLSSSSLLVCCVCSVASVVSNSLWLCGLQPTRLLCPWDSPDKKTEVGCHALFQGIFLTQGLNPCLLRLLHRRRTLYHWAVGEALLYSPDPTNFFPRINGFKYMNYI